MASTDLRARALSMYERGRLKAALLEATWLTPLVVLALIRCRHLTPTCLASLALVALTVAFRYRGGMWGRAVPPAILASLPALIIPALLPDEMVCCSAASSLPPCWLLCPAAGLLAGGLLGVWLARQPRDRSTGMFAGACLILACGALGCGVMGLAGVAGMVLGASVAAPAALLVLRTSRT